MQLSKFAVSNFKGIRNANFDWDDIVILIGENNAGKSSVLQALQCFLSGSQVKDEALFCEHQIGEENAMELVGHFRDLTDPEKLSPAIQGRTVGDSWILKKRFWCELGEHGEKSWKEQYYSYSEGEVFVNWPAPDNSWANFPEEYQALINQIADRGARPSVRSREQLRGLIREQRADLIGRGVPDWTPSPGGGGNWKSNANSIIPRFIYVKAVHDVTEESNSKEASSYGRIVSLIVEKKLMARAEVIQLKQQIEAVLKLFNPDPNHPEAQAQEIREVEERINARLNQVIGGAVAIRTSDPEIEPMLLPNTRLVIKDRVDSMETSPGHQGHGLQRTLVMTLLQILAEIQAEPAVAPEGQAPPQALSTRAVILAVEEPELYMHPQMERKMRDVLYHLSRQSQFQVICTTHSPVFIDITQSHRTIVRVVKRGDRIVSFFQVSEEMFPAGDPAFERQRLRLVANFNPAVNELFFAKRVVLLEENSAIVAFRTAAELLGVFDRFPNLRHDVTLIDCDGKGNIPLFQKVLNHFHIPHTVVHDEDQGNALEQAANPRIENLLATPRGLNPRHMISPTNLEGLLGYDSGKDKPFRAMKRVEELHAQGQIPQVVRVAVNWIYFAQAEEPAN